MRAADGRLGAAGRQGRVTELENRLCALCLPYLGTRRCRSCRRRSVTSRNLASELTDLLQAEELFTFVLIPEVEPTNNFTERLQRGAGVLDLQGGADEQRRLRGPIAAV